MESLVTKKVTMYAAEAQGNEGFFLALLPAAGALGRFFGPLLSSYILVLRQSSFSDLYAAYARATGGAFDINAAFSNRTYIRNAFSVLAPADQNRLCILVCACL
jgi:hypothetical protein